jgi:hypothetical protein
VSNESALRQARDGLLNVRTLLGIHSPEVRGWSPAVQQHARRAIDLAIAALTAQAAPSEPVARVYLVATGETVDGQETYTRHEGSPPPLCDAECLYTTAQAAPSEPVAPFLWWQDSKAHWYADGEVNRPSHVPKQAFPLYTAPPPPAAPAVARDDFAPEDMAIMRHALVYYSKGLDVPRHRRNRAYAMFQVLRMEDAAPAQPAPQRQEDASELRQALELAVVAMRAPLDDWKGELERKALDAARAVLNKDQAS